MRSPFLITIFFLLSTLHAQQPISPLMEGHARYLEMKQSTPYNLEWISLGPVVNAARVEAVQLDPDKPGTIYAAFGSGNLWKSTNNGLHWKPIFEDQPALGIGDFALAPSNPDIIYVGTGESLKKPRNFTMPGVGVYRSDDGGESWRHLGLEDTWHIGEIAVHPENPDIVLVAAMGHFWSTNLNRGLYRTEDGGKTWKHVLFINDQTAANDIVIAPSDPNYMYVSMWENNPEISGPNTSIYKSTDAGKTWEKCKKGLPKGKQTGRTGLAVSYTNPKKVYALIDNLNKDKTRSAEVYKSIDGGNKWEKTHEQELLFFPGIGWYFTDVYVNPQDDEEIFCLGVRLAHSKNGGKSFEYIGGDVYHIFPSAADHLHLDHCELWINPKNPNHLALGNDGGLYQSYDKGKSWTHFNNIPTGEFYDISIGPQDPYIIYGGTQDDATVFGPGTEWNPEFDDLWDYLWIDAWSGGDGCFTHADPEDPNTVYFSMQHGAFRRKDMAMDTSISIRPKLPPGHSGKLEFSFVAPYFISPHDAKTLYAAGNYVMKSTNKGRYWDVMSSNLNQSADPEKRGLAAGYIAESTLQPGLLYVGMDRGAFWVSEDDGANWKERSTGIANNYIRSISPSQHKIHRVYMAMNGMNYDDLHAYVYASEDDGKTWRSIKGNLPDQVVNVILEDPVYEDILYAGLNSGIYISTNRGISWDLLGKNMAMTSISDLEIHLASKDLVAATHGRGIYKMNLKPIHEAYQNGFDPETVQLFGVPTAIRPYRNDTHRDYNYRTTSKVPFSFYLPKASPVELEIFSEGGRKVLTKNWDAQAGFHQFRWDLILRRRKSLNPYHIFYDEFIDKGNYTLKLMVGEQVLEQPFVVEDW